MRRSKFPAPVDSDISVLKYATRYCLKLLSLKFRLISECFSFYPFSCLLHDKSNVPNGSESKMHGRSGMYVMTQGNRDGEKFRR